MNKNFKPCLGYLLAAEGGFSDDPQDPGGVTNLGVTRAMWAAWTVRNIVQVPLSEMRGLSTIDVTPLYYIEFWKKAQCDVWPLGLDYCVLDMAVNSGLYESVLTLQNVVGTKVDGNPGPATVDAVSNFMKTVPLATLIERFCAARLNYLKTLPGFAHDGVGWTTRVNLVQTVAKNMAA